MHQDVVGLSDIRFNSLDKISKFGPFRLSFFNGI